MSFLLKKYKKRPPVNNNFKHILYGSSSQTPPPITICDKDIYKMNYNMDTIKKRVAQLFVNPVTTCYYFASIGITNLALTTYNDSIHKQAKICFKVLNYFETSHNIAYAVFAGNAIGLLRTGKNLPWADDYDIIMFKHDVDFFMNDIIPELERVGFKVKIKIVDGVISGAKIFGPPNVFDNLNSDNTHNNHNISIFQCDVFFSYFDSSGFLKNCGGWGLYHEKNIPQSAVFPLKRRKFHGMLLPFLNDTMKEVKLCYGNIQKCSIFSHHLDSTIFYQRWEHAYKDFDHIKKAAIENTRKYITRKYQDQHENECKTSRNTLLLTESVAFEEMSELCGTLFHNNGRDFHVSVLKKLDFLRYLYQKNIGTIIISPLISLQHKTNFILEDLKHKRIIDAADYNYNAPGLKIIGDHTADIKYYFPYIKVIYQESIGDAHGEYALSPLFYGYIDVMRISRARFDQVYEEKIAISKKYDMFVPTIEIIDSE